MDFSGGTCQHSVALECIPACLLLTVLLVSPWVSASCPWLAPTTAQTDRLCWWQSRWLSSPSVELRQTTKSISSAEVQFDRCCSSTCPLAADGGEKCRIIYICISFSTRRRRRACRFSHHFDSFCGGHLLFAYVCSTGVFGAIHMCFKHYCMRM